MKFCELCGVAIGGSGSVCCGCQTVRVGLGNQKPMPVPQYNMPTRAVKCPVCNDSGKYAGEQCHGCAGKGWVAI